MYYAALRGGQLELYRAGPPKADPVSSPLRSPTPSTVPSTDSSGSAFTAGGSGSSGRASLMPPGLIQRVRSVSTVHHALLPEMEL